MRKWLNTYFDFTRGEFNGLLTLFFLILLVSLLPYTFRWIWPEDNDTTGDLAAIGRLEWKDSVQTAERKPYHRVKRYPKNNMPVSDFDPNDLDANGWQNLGLSPKQAQAIARYTEKGGQFYKKEDVKKMYTISPEMYARLEPHIRIERSDTVRNFPLRERYTPRVLAIFEINTADTLQLQEIRGIGPAFARRIATYRERLGGFYHIKQLREVYGIDSLKYEQIKPQLRVEATGLRMIHINTAAFEDLKNHPYLTYKQVGAIIQYRKQHGKYGSFADLKKVALLTSETVDHLAPYLSFDYD
jgi:competence ComEA-like helix-hairpin-helix protein